MKPTYSKSGGICRALLRSGVTSLGILSGLVLSGCDGPVWQWSRAGGDLEVVITMEDGPVHEHLFVPVVSQAQQSDTDFDGGYTQLAFERGGGVEQYSIQTDRMPAESHPLDGCTVGPALLQSGVGVTTPLEDNDVRWTEVLKNGPVSGPAGDSGIMHFYYADNLTLQFVPDWVDAVDLESEGRGVLQLTGRWEPRFDAIGGCDHLSFDRWSDAVVTFTWDLPDRIPLIDDLEYLERMPPDRWRP